MGTVSLLAKRRRYDPYPPCNIRPITLFYFSLFNISTLSTLNLLKLVQVGKPWADKILVG